MNKSGKHNHAIHVKTVMVLVVDTYDEERAHVNKESIFNLKGPSLSRGLSWTAACKLTLKIILFMKFTKFKCVPACHYKPSQILQLKK